MKDVRSDASRLWAKVQLLRHFSIRFELFQVAGKVADEGKPSSPGRWFATLPLVMTGLLNHEVGGQWSAVLAIGNVPGKPG